VGREGIRSRMREVFARVRMTMGTIKTADVFMMGDTAYETGRGTSPSVRSAPPPSNPIRAVRRGLEARGSGAWKIWRDIALLRAPGRGAAAPGAASSIGWKISRDIGVPKGVAPPSRRPGPPQGDPLRRLIDGRGARSKTRSWWSTATAFSPWAPTRRADSRRRRAARLDQAHRIPGSSTHTPT